MSNKQYSHVPSPQTLANTILLSVYEPDHTSDKQNQRALVLSWMAHFT